MYRRLSSTRSSQCSRETLATVEGVAREARRRFLGHELKSYRLLGLLA